MLLVYVDMVADLFHAGHVAFLAAARRAAEQQADQAGAHGVELIVGLMGDEAAAAYKRRPVCSLAERAAVVGACRYVDRVVLDPPMPVTAEFLRSIGADLVIHGDDMGPDELRHWYGAAIDAGIFMTVPYTAAIGGVPVSTSAIIDRILRRSGSAQ